MPAVLIVLLFILAPLAAKAQSTLDPGCSAPIAAGDGWPTASPDSAGLDTATLCGIGPRLERWTEANIHSVLVIRHGKLVYEHYFTGPDETLGHRVGPITFDAATKHDVRSIEKSVAVLVLGIMLQQGKMPSIDQPVLPQFPEYADLRSAERDRITLRHLLTMSQGLTWDETLPYSDPRNSETQMDFSPDPVRYALSQPIQSAPGSVWNYSTGSTTILAVLLRKWTGQTLDTLARTELFEPLGITDYEWAHLPSGDLSPYGLRMRPRDLAKIGQLVLQHGAWNGRQIVPADWIATATSPQIAGVQLYYYGFQFWLGRSLVHGRSVDWIAGFGYGGQRLFIVPTLDLVVLVHAGLYDSRLQDWVPLMIFNRYVLQATASP